ncbi:LOW QUALITY PROTEIN: cysteine-rich secretory protein LCCL domain-containing 1-like [Ictidomys tridecemlineatus]
MVPEGEEGRDTSKQMPGGDQVQQYPEYRDAPLYGRVSSNPDAGDRSNMATPSVQGTLYFKGKTSQTRCPSEIRGETPRNRCWEEIRYGTSQGPGMPPSMGESPGTQIPGVDQIQQHPESRGLPTLGVNPLEPGDNGKIRYSRTQDPGGETPRYRCGVEVRYGGNQGPVDTPPLGARPLKTRCQGYIRFEGIRPLSVQFPGTWFQQYLIFPSIWVPGVLSLQGDVPWSPLAAVPDVPLAPEGSDSYYPPREEETNEIERQRAQIHDTHVQTRSDDSNRNEVISIQQMSQIVSCEVRLRDQCKGTTCNRYECPAGCLDSKAKVIGSVHYEMQSSICRASIHYGIIDNEGGWVDITRQGRKHYFIKSNRNGVQTIGKYQSANSFTVSKVTVQAVTCETTVKQLCPFHKPASHCPRVYCPCKCMQANPHYARVIGSRIYSDLSSICGAAGHAGVVQNHGGYVDVMPVDKRKTYMASFQNGIFSESLQNPPGGKAFRVFAVL